MQGVRLESSTLLRPRPKSEIDGRRLWIVLALVAVVGLCALISVSANEKRQDRPVMTSNALSNAKVSAEFLTMADLKWVPGTGKTCVAACQGQNLGPVRSGVRDQNGGQGYFVCSSTNSVNGFTEHGHTLGVGCYIPVGNQNLGGVKATTYDCLCKPSNIPSAWISNRGIEPNCNRVCGDEGYLPVTGKSGSGSYVCSQCITGWGCRSGSNNRQAVQPWCNACSGIRVDPRSMSCLCVLQ